MTTTFLAPDPIQSTQFIPGGNTPANGGQLFFYLAGTSTKQSVYKDNAASSGAWSNPIVLDSGGNLPSGQEVWFSQGIAYKVVFAPANDTDPPASPYWSKDNLSGVNDVAASSISDWVADSTPTFVSATSFSLSGDQTAKYVKGRRIKTTNTSGTVYSTVVTSAFAAGSTTVTVVSDSGTQLDSGLSAVSYGLISPAAVSINDTDIFRKNGSTVTATATTDIWSTAGDYVHIGSTNATIFSFSTAPYVGARRELTFDGSITLNSSATLILPQGGPLSVISSDTLIVRAESASVAAVLGVAHQGSLIRVKSFTDSTVANISTGTMTTLLHYRMVGGGGQGGSAVNSNGATAAAGPGGGSGCYAEGFFTVNPNSTYAVSIGTGGSGGGAPAGNGGNTTLTVNGTTVIAPGGFGGNRGNGATSTMGAPGSTSNAASNASFSSPGVGGVAGFFVPGTALAAAGQNVPTPLGNWGSGGQGANVSGNTSSTGAIGVVGAIVIYEYR